MKQQCYRLVNCVSLVELADVSVNVVNSIFAQHQHISIFVVCVSMLTVAFSSKPCCVEYRLAEPAWAKTLFNHSLYVITSL